LALCGWQSSGADRPLWVAYPKEEAGGADLLLTTDDKILAKAQKLQGSLHVRIENPILWLMEVRKDEGSNSDSCPD